LIHQNDARYPLQLQDAFGGVGPHCLECYTAVSEAPRNEL
jgi:hypothetical protein